MTLARSYIVFNASTGSDSAASGLGPSTAVIGSSAELDGSSTVDLSYDGVDLSGISVGDLLFCETTSGRKFSIISAVDTINETITTDDVWGTESGVSWAVGGKRATFDHASSRALFANGVANYSVIYTETNQTLTSAIQLVLPSNSPIIFRGSWQERVGLGSTIECTGDFPAFNVAGSSQLHHYYGLKFLGSVNNTSWAIYGGGPTVHSCQFGEPGGSQNFLNGVVSRLYFGRLAAYRCKFFGQGSASGTATAAGSWHASVYLRDCITRDYATGSSCGDSLGQVERCVFYNCGRGLISSRRYWSVRKCIFQNISGNAIEDFTGSENEEYIIASNLRNHFNENLFHNVSGYIRVFRSYTDVPDSYIENAVNVPPINYCYNSPLGVQNGYSQIVTLDTDPMVSQNPNDPSFKFNNLVGGGKVLRSLQRLI